MFNLKQQKKKGFTTVEILVAVGLVAILMVVAVPRLLDLRGGVSDSSAKQQLNAVKVTVDNWFAERDTFTGLDAAAVGGGGTEIQKRQPDVQIVGGNEPTGKGASRSLKVSVHVVSSSEVVLAASNGEDICWGIKVSKAGTQYAGKLINDPTACRAASTFGTGDWKPFEFPVVR